MLAILSDIHANLEALCAVMEDLQHREVQQVIFLGDIIGYGPDPRRVLDFLRHFEFCLLGNHDEAALKGPPPTFNPLARRATLWTRRQIHPDQLKWRWAHQQEYEVRLKNWLFLETLQPVRRVGDLLFVHDYPAQPGSWKYLRRVGDALVAFRAHPQVRAFFVGHSHVPLITTAEGHCLPEPGKKYRFASPVAVNVGSVGQPRDQDPRACYVIADEEGYRFFRVPYPLEITQEKIRSQPALDPQLAVRLAQGI